MPDQTALTDSAVHPLILQRRSPRAFSPEPVSPADLRTVFTASSWAASSYNEQPWRFVVGQKGDATYESLFRSLIDFNKTWCANVPTLILAVAKRTITKDGSINGHSGHDTGAASANLALQASALGLFTHGMAGFDRELVRLELQIPADFEPLTVWAIGHLGDPGALPDFLQNLERAPRTRKPLSEIVFTAWDQPADL